jgi:hypothetical protein
MSLTVDRVVDALRQHLLARPDIPQPTLTGDGWLCACPACGADAADAAEGPALVVAQNGVGPRLRCANGCDEEMILFALGLSDEDDEDGLEQMAQRVRQAWRLRCAETDVGNARRLVSEYRDKLRYAPGIGWLFWDLRRWKRDEDGEAMRCAKAAVNLILAEEVRALSERLDAATTDEEKDRAKRRRNARLAHWKRSESRDWRRCSSARAPRPSSSSTRRPSTPTPGC